MNKELENKTKQNKEELLNGLDSQLSNDDLSEITGGIKPPKRTGTIVNGTAHNQLRELFFGK